MRAYYLFEEVQSTMLEYDRIRSISKPNTSLMIRAMIQTSGFGRGGHKWHSPWGGLWITFDLFHPQTLDSFALFAGFCLHKMLTQLYKLPELYIKWTNDIYYRDKKLAGLLCRYQMVEGYYVIGLGLNTNNITELTEYTPNPISLQEILGFELSNDYLSKLYVQEIHKNKELLNKPQEYLEYCDAHLYGKGEMGSLDQGDKTLEGKIVGLDEKGNLLLDVGEIISVNYGSLKLN